MRKQRIVHKLLLDTKVDIPFPSAELVLHQPSIAEIGMIGEHSFLTAVNALTKDYKSIKIEDNSNLDNLTNFDILMSMIREKTENSKLIVTNLLLLFDLILPNQRFIITPGSFIFQDKVFEEGQTPKNHMIDKNNFEEFSQIINEMFGMDAFKGDTGDDYNPGGDRARALVEKFKEKREYLAQLRQERGEDTATASIFGRYMNILAVGEKKDKNQLAQYSVYQLIEEFKRFELKEGFDYTLQAKMAGAKNVTDAKDWMQDITLGIEKEE